MKHFSANPFANLARLKNIAWLHTLIASMVIFSANSQNNTSQLPVTLPPSPNAASLDKYIEIPVGTYTGVPNITIPLYEIKSRDISIPISLSYHAAGNRVEEEASWVGLGWTLNAGGAISRTIRGLDDFVNYYNASAAYSMPQFNYPGYSANCDEDIASGKDYCNNPPPADIDWEPDSFYYNFLSQNGKFVLDQSGHAILIEQQKIKIELPGPGHGFIIRSSNGFRYEFFSEETTNTLSNVSQSGGTTSWYLSRIISPSGEKVSFTYDRTSTAIFPVRSFSSTENKESIGGCPANYVDGGNYQSTHIDALYLRRIDFKTGFVEFERDTQPREDLLNAQRLKKIRVYKRGLIAPLREFELISSYFISPSEQFQVGNYSYTVDDHAYAAKRLRLDRVVESNGNVTKPPYVFSYNGMMLPYKTSYNRDHWGFFNGANNTSLIPGFEGIAPVTNTYLNIVGANREPNHLYAKACVLEQIQSPSGGTTKFAFESNDYGNMNAQDQNQWSSRTFTAYARAFPGGIDNPGPALFTIASNNTPVTFQIRLDIPNCSQSCQDDYMYLKVQQLNGPYVVAWSATNTGTGTFVRTITLPAGQYEMSAQTSSVFSNTYVWGQASIKEQTPISIYKKTGAGLRISSIVYEDNNALNPPISRYYKYNKTIQDASGIHTGSYGILMSRPRYTSYVQRPYSSNGVCTAFQLSSYSNSQLSGSAQGALIGYSQVEEWLGNEGQFGKTVFLYNNQEDLVYDYQQRVPGVPNIPYPLNGYMTNKIDYKKHNNGFVKAAEIINYYEASNQISISGVFRGPLTRIMMDDSGTMIEIGCSACDAPMHKYKIFSYFVHKTGSTNIKYSQDDETKFTQTATSYIYDVRNVGHLQLSRTETKQSDGNTFVTEMTYPADYTAVNSGFIAEMRNDSIYQHSTVIETITSSYGPNETILQAKALTGNHYEYAKPSPASRYLPITHKAFELLQPTNNLTVAAPNMPSSGRYVTKSQTSYDPISANIRQLDKSSDAPVCFVWGYQNSCIIASIKNASINQVEAVLNSTGSSLVDLNLVTDEVQLRNTFALLRQRLPSAQITSETYLPLVGINSKTEADGRSTFYEYDALGRLVCARDEQGRILYLHDYKYALQP